MKRLLVISFLFIFLSANTAFGELLKLPLLIQHYTEHKQEETAISFIHFLAEHYKGTVNHQHNNHHHDNLPFKTLNTHSGSVISLIPNPIFSLHKQFFPEDNTIIPAYLQSNYANAYLNGIWQPPRFS
ncbi:MAG: hypothetical protein KF862_23605 [Chitinophagaceae bacterium]|nr:hypothetical protein [Chitinophagaceae bacterium]